MSIGAALLLLVMLRLLLNSLLFTFIFFEFESLFSSSSEFILSSSLYKMPSSVSPSIINFFFFFSFSPDIFLYKYPIPSFVFPYKKFPAFDIPFNVAVPPLFNFELFHFLQNMFSYFLNPFQHT
jgi:hypothetical protein